MLRVGVDLGGTKIEASALDASGIERDRVRRPTPQGDYAATLATIAAMVLDLEGRGGDIAADRAHVGIGMPGSLSPADGRVRNANSTCLNGRDLRADLAARLPRPTRFANDANCFALSEAVDGAGEGARVVFGVILGTGVGAGIAIDARVLEGANSIAGEWGHNPLPNPGAAERGDAAPACYCGRRGCVETWLSGPALATDHERECGQRLEAPAIARRAAEGDAAARATLDRYLDRAARSLAGVINLLDPDVIVLGGGVSEIEALYAGIPARWAPHVFSDSVATRLLRSRHGPASGVRGAAWLWPAEQGAD